MTLARNKAAGRRWETTIAAYLTDRFGRPVERRRLNGTVDRGDLAGIPHLIIEAKDVARWDVWNWLDQAEIEAAHDTAHTGTKSWGVVWKKRPGSTAANAGVVFMTPETFCTLWALAQGTE